MIDKKRGWFSEVGKDGKHHTYLNGKEVPMFRVWEVHPDGNKTLAMGPHHRGAAWTTFAMTRESAEDVLADLVEGGSSGYIEAI